MKKRVTISALCLLLCLSARSASIQQADSLFTEKKYTESFEVYRELLEQEKVVSPSMLLKMAYIKEGLGGYSDALYYLNLYYLQTADRDVLEKMEVLATKKELEGYESSDFEFAQTIFYKYYFTIVIFLLGLAILMLSFTYYLKSRNKSGALAPAVAMTLTLGLLFYVLNFGKSYDKSIVMKSNTYLMTGPSAAAEVIEVIKKGNRLSTKGTQDIWTEVAFNNKTGYVKSSKLKSVSLN